MIVAVTYDLDSGWNEVKAAALAGPFVNIVKTSQGDKQAPNTTLFVNNMTPADALVAFDKAVATASVKLGRKIVVEKVFAARMEDWRIRSDGPKQKAVA